MEVEPTHDGPSDHALVERAAAGDVDAFGSIYARYQRVVYRFARAMTGSADAAADITQEVFTALLRDLPRYDPRRSALSTYLYGMARNLSRSRLRRERRFQSLDAVDGNSHVIESLADPHEHLAGIQSAAQMRRAFGSLPHRYREVIVLCDLHDLAYSEAAAVIHVSVGTIRWRLHRGRQLLRERLRRVQRTHVRHASPAAGCAI
jgi:RNA polymerase sigma-70 factor, ECF subfamily